MRRRQFLALLGGVAMGQSQRRARNSCDLGGFVSDGWHSADRHLARSNGRCATPSRNAA